MIIPTPTPVRQQFNIDTMKGDRPVALLHPAFSIRTA